MQDIDLIFQLTDPKVLRLLTAIWTVLADDVRAEAVAGVRHDIDSGLVVFFGSCGTSSDMFQSLGQNVANHLSQLDCSVVGRIEVVRQSFAELFHNGHFVLGELMSERTKSMDGLLLKSKTYEIQWKWKHLF